MARRRTHARARRRDSEGRTHHGRCCHRRLNDGRRLIGPPTHALCPAALARRQAGLGGRRRDLGRAVSIRLAFVALASVDSAAGTGPRWHGEVGELGEAEQRRGAGEEEEVVVAVAALQDPWLGAGRARPLEFARPLRLPLEWLTATDGEESSWLLG
jgi:hypothetical protein